MEIRPLISTSVASTASRRCRFKLPTKSFTAHLCNTAPVLHCRSITHPIWYRLRRIWRSRGLPVLSRTSFWSILGLHCLNASPLSCVCLVISWVLGYHPLLDGRLPKDRDIRVLLAIVSVDGNAFFEDVVSTIMSALMYAIAIEVYEPMIVCIT
ncbi:hypothetical protein C7974DRAFT_206894 [Boeremia exigua]|uniref:uncharacterized protein n=1 Tax=Boeremia exigua TaxID=749465 RepID=UPI001E8CDDF6|nr:uncharacterized protein C7974DRAFT_206894 [Boeremia exigua]KAH6625758.1 hypothetical protein C7974DRAFT_206894 [Boeremia exigua]